jgi:hypothetical protein
VAAGDITPYSSAAPLLSKLPDYISDEVERQRIASYTLYESMYWNVPGTFKVSQRGSNTDPIYVPAARQIIETFNRFLAPGMSVVVDPAFGTPNDQLLAAQVWTDFSAREKFNSKFNTGKRYGLIRGDWAWHIWADPLREEGSKISVYQIDPSTLFPIYDVNNIDNIIGWHIIETVLDNSGKPFVVRATYLKETLTGGPSPIVYTKARYDVDDWGGPGMDQDPKVVEVITPPTTLPPPIDALPIYVIQNFDEPGSLWGASELRGMERLIAGLNQAISDEELALALEGLGVYATDSGTPINDEGEDEEWNMGPGRVVEVGAGKQFWRVNGVNTVGPYQQHLDYLHSQIDAVFGHSAVAKGNVDVNIAPSGISLLLQLGPILSRAIEREVIITDVHRQFLYGLGKWFSAFEGSQFNSLWEVTKWQITYGPKIPEDRQQAFENLLKLAAAVIPIVPVSYIRDRLRKLGYEDMPDEASIATLMTNEATARAQVSQDAVGTRMDTEADAFLS